MAMPTKVTMVVCTNPKCTKLHNQTGHHYGCDCWECMHEYYELKHSSRGRTGRVV